MRKKIKMAVKVIIRKSIQKMIDEINKKREIEIDMALDILIPHKEVSRIMFNLFIKTESYLVLRRITGHEDIKPSIH